MTEYIERDAASADSDRNKIKTPFARIVVEGTPGKPCYNIWYFDPANGECHIGFGSYCLDNVFNWLAEEFEITEPYTDMAPVVRCKDCKHSTLPSELTQRYGKPGTLTCHNMHAPSNRRNVGSNDFCSYGARMDDDESGAR